MFGITNRVIILMTLEYCFSKEELNMCVTALAQSYHSLAPQHCSACPVVVLWGNGRVLQNGASDLGVYKTENGDYSLSVISF